MFPGTKRARGGTGIVVLVIVVVLAAIGGFAGYWYSEYRKPSIDNLVALMPADAHGVMVMRGLPKLAVDYKIWEVHKTFKDSGNPAYTEAVAEIMSFFDIEGQDEQTAFLRTGFDLMRPMGISLHLADPKSLESFTAVCYLPVADREKADAVLLKILADHPATQDDVDPDVMLVGPAAYTYYQDHLVVAMSPDVLHSRALLKAVRNVEGRVTDNAWYRDAGPLLAEEWEFFTAFNPTLPPAVTDLIEAQAAEIPQSSRDALKELEKWSGMAAIMDIEPDQLRIKSTGTIKPGYEVDNLAGERRDLLAESLPGSAVGNMRVAVDFPALLAYYKKTMPDEMDAAIAQMRDAMGIDLENDLLVHLGSPMVLTVFDGDDETTAGYGGALRLPLKDTEAVASVIDRLTEGAPEDQLLKEQVDGVTWTRVDMGGPMVSWALTKDHLVVLMGEKTTASTSAALSKGATDSYLDAVTQPEVRNSLSHEGDYSFYVDLAKVVDNHRAQLLEMPDAEKAMPVFNSFGSLWATSSYTANGVDGVMVLKAGTRSDFSDLFLHVAEMAAQSN